MKKFFSVCIDGGKFLLSVLFYVLLTIGLIFLSSAFALWFTR